MNSKAYSFIYLAGSVAAFLAAVLALFLIRYFPLPDIPRPKELHHTCPKVPEANYVSIDRAYTWKDSILCYSDEETFLFRTTPLGTTEYSSELRGKMKILINGKESLSYGIKKDLCNNSHHFFGVLAFVFLGLFSFFRFKASREIS